MNTNKPVNDPQGCKKNIFKPHMETEKLEMILERLRDSNEDIQTNALDILHDEVRSTAGTITTEQQQLFDILGTLKLCLKNMNEANKKHLSDIISVLSVGTAEDSSVNVLKFRLAGNCTELDNWGHQYVKQLISACIKVRQKEIEIFNYAPLVGIISTYLFQHNSEIEAIDFLIEISDLMPFESSGIVFSPKGTDVNMLDLILKNTDKDNFDRIYEYLVELNSFYPLNEMILEMTKMQETRHLVHLLEYNMFDDAVVYVRNIKNSEMKKQCLYILARANVYFCGNEEEELILTNKHIKKFFLDTAENLEVLQSKKIDQILKGLNKDKIDAAAVCNGLIHFGFNRDPVFYRHKDDYSIKSEYISLLNQKEGTGTTLNASLGCISCFDHKQLLNDQAGSIFEHRDIGLMLGVAISAYRSHDSDNTVLELFSGILGSDEPKEIIPCLFGLSLIYSGSHGKPTDDAYEKLFPLLNHPAPDVVCMTIYAMGVLFMGSANADIVGICCEVFSDIDANKSKFYNLAILGVALVFYERPEMVESDIFSSLPRPVQILVLGMVHLGSGKPNAVEEIMNMSFTGDTEPLNESIGLLACALIAVSDPVASAMVERHLMSSLMLNNPHIKNVVPLCLALLYPSTGKHQIVDFLERSINSREVNVSSLVALGIIGAGTNSSRILSIMSANHSFLYKDVRESNALIYAQGLVNLAKGMCTLSPTAFDGSLILDKSLVGLLSTVFLFIGEKSKFFEEDTFVLYSIIQAITPKYVTGIEGEIKVGKPVDTVGLTGTPNKISGMVVHTAPVILNSFEKAETNVSVCSCYIEDILVKKAD